MSFEIAVLAAATIWGFVQLIAAAQASNFQYGLRWAASPRDEEMPPLAPIPGRINRNFRNYMETFPFFVTAVLIAEVAGVHNAMTHWGAIAYLGGRPANFLEIGGDAYTQAKPALELVLANPRVKSLVVNFCGAFARTDVMADGVVQAWKSLKPAIPVFFSIHGTGEDEAVALVRRELGIEPFDLMEDAVRAAVEAAR